jgi:ribonuclease HIII
MNKYDYFEDMRKRLEGKGILAGEYREINYGLQFSIEMNGVNHVIRIFESSKHGVREDFSLIKDNAALEQVLKALKKDEACGGSLNGPADTDENPIIGTDESGKGDYFGPLVIAGVYADQSMKEKLRILKVADSKKLSDQRVALLASEIKRACISSVVVIGNQRYNELYEKFGNLNKLLAWGHARAIENILDRTECGIALSDQFGNPDLITNALMDKGKKIVLEQRPRAEENLVVAAASILARNEFVIRLKALSEKYEMELPKGASGAIVTAGIDFILRHGDQNLNQVAKLHFKTTSEIIKHKE